MTIRQRIGLAMTYPKNWGEIVSQILERDNYTCQACGYSLERLSELYDLPTDTYPRLITAHHIDRNTKNNDPSNLTSLCRWCHASTHKSPTIKCTRMHSIIEFQNKLDKMTEEERDTFSAKVAALLGIDNNDLEYLNDK